MATSQTKPSAHVANILRATRQHHPNFTLFLGAGASVESAVPTGKALVKEWRESFAKLYCDGGDREKELAKQPWFDQPDEYARLFEILYDQPSQRREFIEQCLEKASPSWGYIYLVHLIQERVFNAVFTTNFDDLLNEACYQFSTDVRPLVCAHDSSIRSVRVTSKRPKIIKLHGDFLFDSIKNTTRELESLESNIREKFRQFAGEYGMIVVGYSGNDRSVMDTLDSLLRSEENFPHGVYWCVRDEHKISKEVDALRRFSKFNLVKVHGFDAFMCELHDAVQIGPHPVIENPFDVIAGRFNSLMRNLTLPSDGGTLHPSLERDAALLGDRLMRGIAQHQSLELPFRLLAWNARRNRDFVVAQQRILQHIRSLTRPDMDPLRFAIEVLVERWDGENFDQFLKEMARITAARKDPKWSLDASVMLINAGRFSDARQLLRTVAEYLQFSPTWVQEFHWINMIQCKVHEGEGLTDEERDRAIQIRDDSPNMVSRFGANCLLRDAASAAKLIQQHTTPDRFFGGIPLSEIEGWPISRLLPPEIFDGPEALTELEQTVNPSNEGTRPGVVVLPAAGTPAIGQPTGRRGSAKRNKTNASSRQETGVSLAGDNCETACHKEVFHAEKVYCSSVE